MTPSLRRWVFLAGAAGFVAFYLWGLLGLPGFVTSRIVITSLLPSTLTSMFSTVVSFFGAGLLLTPRPRRAAARRGFVANSG